MRAPFSASARRAARDTTPECVRALAAVGGVGRIGADRRVEHDREIGDAARDRSADVLRARERHDAGAARQALRAAQARPGCCATPDCGSIRRCRCPCPPAAKFAATAAPVPPLDPPGLRSRSYGFFVCPKREPDGRDARRELVHVRLAEDDGARLLQAAHQKRVAPRMKRGQRDRAGAWSASRSSRSCPSPAPGCRAAGPRTASPRARRRARRRPRARCGLSATIAFSAGPLLIVGLDARQIEIDELPRRDLARLHRPLQVLDRLLHHVERPRPRGADARAWAAGADVPTAAERQRRERRCCRDLTSASRRR